MVHTLKSGFKLDIIDFQPRRLCPGNDLFVRAAQYHLLHHSQNIALAAVKSHLKAQREGEEVDLVRVAAIFACDGTVIARDAGLELWIQHCTPPYIDIEAGTKEDEVVISVIFSVDCLKEEQDGHTSVWNQRVVFSVTHRVDVYDYQLTPTPFCGRSISERSFLGEDVYGAPGWAGSTPSLSLTERLDSNLLSLIGTVAQSFAWLSHSLVSATGDSLAEQNRSIAT